MSDNPTPQPITVRDAVSALDRAPLTPLDLLQRAVQSNAQVEVMEKLLGLQERWERNEGRKAFDAAVAAAKAEIPVIRKGNQVDFTTQKGRTNYAYEDLATIAQTIDPILSKFGLSYRFRTNSDSKSVTITCVLSHAAGHSEETTLGAPHDVSGNKNAIQAVGSAVTYLQRYTLKAALGLAAAADDDARSASPPEGQRQQAPPPAQSAPPPPSGQRETWPSVQVCSVKEVHSKPDAPKKWTAWFITFSDGEKDVEAGTFDTKVSDLAKHMEADALNGRLVTEPGKKQGSRSIVSLELEDDVPMGEPDGTPEPQ